MKKETRNTHDCFQLLHSVLLEAFQIESHLFTPPYGDFSQIDHGIRSMLWPDFSGQNIRPTSASHAPDRRLLIIKSNLGFFNLIAYLTLDETPDFISIGPFRSEEFSTDHFSRISKELRLNSSSNALLQAFFEGLPYVPLSSIINITRTILSTHFPEFEKLEPTPVEFSDQSHVAQLDMDLLMDYSADYAETYQKTLLHFLAALKKGDAELAQSALKKFIQETRFVSSSNVTMYKRQLNALNDYCHMALLETSVHPGHILRLNASMKLKINGTSSPDTLSGLPIDICRKYCLLVKNYAYTEYSKTIRAVINYIHLHLDEDLSLSHLAKHFYKNPASLSASFSREVGMSVTDFIHQTRINEAIRYFNTSELSISEVAIAVGFQDFSYFSRLFRKQVGCNPREYCRSIK